MQVMRYYHSSITMPMPKEKDKFKILMFPWLAHGHIHPFLQLSKKLSSRNFTIYLCSTAANLESIKPSIENELSDDDPWIELIELQIPPSCQLPPHLHTTKNLPSNLIPALLQAFQKSSSSFSKIMDSVNPDLLIYDMFQPWAPKMASREGVPSVYFATSGATCFSYYHHVHSMGSGATFPYKAISLPNEAMDRVLEHIVPNLKDADDDFAFGNFSRSCEIVLMKSSKDLEEKYVDYLSVLCKKQIVCTGPLIADCNNDESLEIMKWLNVRGFRSTVYVSFGSECFLSKDQIGEIVKGLEICGVGFLWVIRFPDGEKIGCLDDVLPEGFVEKVKGRGLVVTKWAPQTKILGHPSVGGFLSHCGWSSVLEGVYFGVPIIAMPMKYEQPINAQLVVESGVGVGVERDGTNEVYVGEEVAKAISKVMVEKTFYEKVGKVGEMMREKEEEEMNEAAEHLLRICIKNKKQTCGTFSVL